MVDADGMGRAFPEMQMVTFSVYGASGSPFALASEHGDTVILDIDDKQSRRIHRSGHHYPHGRPRRQGVLPYGWCYCS